jgi:subtilisin family serine protease
MNRSVRLAAPLLAALIAWPALAVADPPATRDYVVGFHDLPSERRQYGGDAVVAQDDSLRFLVVRTSNPDALERRAAADPHVAWVEPDGAVYRALGANDPLYGPYQYDLHPSTTDIDTAWAVTRGSTAVKVCVADSGQYRAHQDFAGTAWAEWRDLVGGKTTPYDDNGHGTHVTGTLAAVTDNGKGIAGIAQVSVAGAKVLDRRGLGTLSGVASGITWCADIGSKVINLSLGGPASTTVTNAVNYATGKGALVVAAAGNSGPCINCVDHPAALDNAFAVACTDQDNRQCSFSSEGPQVDIAAPGASIASTYPPLGSCGKNNSNCYVLISGTSQSTPHVAALAALIWSAHPAETVAGVRARITSTAVDLGAPGVDPEFGAGIMRGAAVV